ncbi:medium chain dehydrogenase/reductase family protein [Actinoplanes bogorensis]|uniref:Medium chain dehydrogenase/reductase family protein n=1 Tax=Paractinoplanes bogorensis TaxID=1610840 RepID=A0ABS5Z5L8_9ACTN|nr:medium chain dehydrogenase/reductase family protein [Actinoplanes bogorensis]MBU2670234.1 medium chain dehydrogenase/reductase family protein [Actinoplanes bogorensis]
MNISETTEVVLPGVVEPSGLELRTRELPPPGPGQALVAVEASGVSFAEQAMRRGRYPGQPKFPFVPGYDVVGTVASVGPGADPALVGRRVAAITKTGGWATHVLLAAGDLVPVPAGLDPGDAETVVVNGVTAWQMLHRRARVRPGATILVHGANGGVGTTLAQLARLDDIRVIGTANPRHHDALRALGVIPLDHADPALADRIRELAPGGVDAAFDNLGGDHLRRAWHLTARGGSVVCYSIAAHQSGPMVPAFLVTLARLAIWNALPNGKQASFYDLWSGKKDIESFRSRTREDLTAVLDLLAAGRITAQVAARVPLTDIGEAMTLAEARTVPGKVVVVPA